MYYKKKTACRKKREYRNMPRMGIVVHDKKVCKSCGEELPIEEFTRLHTARDGRSCNCKKCLYEKQRKRKEEKKNFYLF